ncbi:MAG TPA: Spy/CpxP family protein refolding chaperone [Candidatus Obscuribacterales bacterium]
MKRLLALLIAASVIVPAGGLLATTQLQAQMPAPTPEATEGQDFHGARAERWLTDMGLSADQIREIRALREGSQAEMQALHEALWSEREALHDLMASDAPVDELRAQHDALQTLQRQVADRRFEQMLAVRTVLTPEQRAAMAARMEEHRENHRANRGFGRDGMGRRGFARW